MLLVSGATGHLGYTVTRRLREEGYNVRVFALPSDDISRLAALDVEAVFGDIRDREAVGRAVLGCEAVIHMAAVVSICKGHARLIHDVNVNGTKNILAASLLSGVKRFVYVSSVHALTETPHGIPIKENMDFKPESVVGTYAQTKAQASIEVMRACSQGLDAVIVFPSGIIGPFDFQRANNSILSLVRLLKTKAGSTVFYVKGGYDFVDVRDVANGIVLALTKGKVGQGYILSGEYISVYDMNKIVAEFLKIPITQRMLPISLAQAFASVNEAFCSLQGKKTIFTPYAVTTLLANSQFDNTKARAELGYGPRSVRQSIMDTLEWITSKDSVVY